MLEQLQCGGSTATAGALRRMVQGIEHAAGAVGRTAPSFGDAGRGVEQLQVVRLLLGQPEQLRMFEEQQRALETAG